VRTRQLGHRVVAVADQHALVELLRPAGRGKRARVGLGCERGDAKLGVVQELVEQHPAEALLGPRVAREERALDDLG